MEKHFMTHTEFADILGISKSTLNRRRIEMGYVFSRRLLTPEIRKDFLEKYHEWEEKRIAELNKKSVTQKDVNWVSFDAIAHFFIPNNVYNFVFIKNSQILFFSIAFSHFL